MASIHEVIARLRADGADTYSSDVRDATAATEEFADTTEESTEAAGSAWDRLGGAAEAAAGVISGAGVAVEGLARKQQDTRAVAGRLANALGEETTDSVMGLASEIHNATTDFDELVGMMETGRQQGITSGDQLQEYAQFWDMVGDATGETAGQLADSSSALRAIGIAAGEEGDALGAFGYVAQETTGGVGDFLKFIERTGPELRGMGADVDDAAAILGVLEQELGMSGRTARQEFRSAINDADGDLDKMLDTLGVSGEAFDSYRGKVSESTGVIEANSDAFAESRTTLQGLSARLETTLADYSGLTAAASSLAPVMIAAYPTTMMLGRAYTFLRNRQVASTVATGAMTVAKGAWSTAAGIASVAAKGLGIAFRFMLGPIGLAITAIGLAVAAAVWLWKNWDDVSEWISDKTERMAAWVSDKISGLVDGVKGAWDRVTGWTRDAWEGLTGTIRDNVNSVIGAVNSMIEAFNRVKITLPTIPDWVPVVGGKGGQTIGLPNIPTIPTLNRGGPVPGPRGANEDSVVAALTPGEWVLNRDAADALGPGILRRLNQLDGRAGQDRALRDDPNAMGGPGYAVGRSAPLPGRLAGQSTIAPLWNFFRQVSGTVFGNGYRAGSTTYHGRGQAIDVTGNYGRLYQAARGVWGRLKEYIAPAPFWKLGSRTVRPYPGRLYNTHVAANRHAHIAATPSSWGSDGGDGDFADEGDGIPFWARPILNAIARAFGSAFGVENATWAGGAYADRPWHGFASVAENEPEFVTPESQLARVIDERLAAHSGGNTIEVTVQVDGDVLDTDAWFDRHRRPLAEAVADAVADRKARR